MRTELQTPGPLVTIGIPTFNRAEGYLRQTLASARAQTWDNVEIVVSDNCSNDGTERYVRGLDDARIRYFRQRHPISPNDNFNYCLDKARGRWFLLLHDDDSIDPAMVETLITAAGDEPSPGLIVGGTRIVDGGGAIREIRPNVSGKVDGRGLIENWIAGRTVLFLCGCLFNTAILRRVGGFHSVTNLLQDVLAELRVAAHGGCLNVPRVLGSFRRHEGEITHRSKVEDWRLDSLELLQVIIEIAGPDIEQQAKRHLTALNYRRAAAIPSPAGRLRAMWETYREFDKAGVHPLRKTARGISAVKYVRRLMRDALAARE